MIVDRRVDYLNFAELYLGRIVLEGRTLVVPVCNLNIMDDVENPILKKAIGSVIELAYVVFRDVEGITWNYDRSRLLDENKRTCIGGDFLITNEHTEFWFEYSGGILCSCDELGLVIRENPFSAEELVESGMAEKLDNIPVLELLTRQSK